MGTTADANDAGPDPLPLLRAGSHSAVCRSANRQRPCRDAAPARHTIARRRGNASIGQSAAAAASLDSTGLHGRAGHVGV